MKHIWFVGAGFESVPGIRKAKELGLKVIASDMAENAPGFAFADHACIASTYDIEHTLAQALQFHDRHAIKGVISVGADVPQTLAALADRLGLNGPSSKTARLTSNKFLMKQALEKAGIPLPRYFAARNDADVEKALDKIGGPVVCKPVDSRGARGVVRVTEDIDTRWAYAAALAASPSRQVLVEEWLPGAQISTESLLIDNRIYTPGLSDRNYARLEQFRPYVIEDGGDLPANLDPDQRQELDRVLLQTARALGLNRWTMKGDVVWTSTGPKIIEVAARLSGGFFCTHTAPLSNGVDILKAAIELALNITPDANALESKCKRFICQRFLFPEPGRVVKVQGTREAARLPGIHLLRMYLKPGDSIPPVTCHPDRGGMVIASGASRIEAQTRAQQALDAILIVTKPLNEPAPDLQALTCLQGL